jgi:protein-S-isoprenylcysteine O-methyltransferase Ste14
MPAAERSASPAFLPTAARWRRWGLVTLAIAALLVGISGDVRSPYLWALIAGCSGVALFVVTAIAPDLARERYHPPSQGLDGALLWWVRPIAMASLVFALLDSGRLHVSPPMEAPWRIAGIAAFLVGLSTFVYAMSVNRFFSSVVRIQDDRGHHVIDHGPYARVRHPGYVGMLLAYATLPLALGSWWTLAPTTILLAFGLHRVWIEDRFLSSNLPGYREYAARVRFRLVPGVW